jgi:hypothetical protein
VFVLPGSAFYFLKQKQQAYSFDYSVSSIQIPESRTTATADRNSSFQFLFIVLVSCLLNSIVGILSTPALLINFFFPSEFIAALALTISVIANTI